ncbi:hypothetical protein TCSYLVIO_008653 [Trypanosoma cruzi]|nr:hypothetical protein TCSYLVIO_008653 [Trypanosoma cruzi]
MAIKYVKSRPAFPDGVGEQSHAIQSKWHAGQNGVRQSIKKCDTEREQRRVGAYDCQSQLRCRGARLCRTGRQAERTNKTKGAANPLVQCLLTTTPESKSMDDKSGNAFSKKSCQEAAGPQEGRKAATAGEAIKTAGKHLHVDAHTTSEWAGSTDQTARKHTHQIRKNKAALNRQELPAQNRFKKVAFLKGESAFPTTARTPRRNFLQISLRRSAGKRGGIKRERNDAKK